MKSFFSTTIQKYNIYAILILEVPELAVISQTLLAFAGIYFWEALHELDAVFFRCNFCCNGNQYDLCDTLFLQKR